MAEAGRNAEASRFTRSAAGCVGAGMFRIRVEDNGVGFEPPSLSDFKGKTSGYGIKSVRERLSFIGGTLTIDTLPGQGTLIIASLPLL